MKKRPQKYLPTSFFHRSFSNLFKLFFCQKIEIILSKALALSRFFW